MISPGVAQGRHMDAATDQTHVMFVHGAWLSSGSWENFARYFGDRGFEVSAPEWPRKEGDVDRLREEIAVTAAR